MSATLEAIRAVAADLSAQGIGKDNFNKEQKFRFRGIDQVHAALSPLLAKHGLVILPNVVARTTGERITKSGSKMQMVSLDVQYVMTHTSGSEPKDAVVTRFHGEGHDSGDKATSKALSMAYKYMAIQTFCIPVDAASVDDADKDSPEASVDENRNGKRAVQAKDGEAGDSSGAQDESTADASGDDSSSDGGDDAPALSAEQAKEIKELLAQAEYPSKPITDYYKVDRVEDLPAAHFRSIKTTLQAKLRTKKAKPQAFQGVRE